LHQKSGKLKYLIIGLGNIGDEYKDTRHNIGFTVLDAFAEGYKAAFTDRRYGSICQIKFKSRLVILLKPSTYVNLSGNAVAYWLKKENVPLENMLVIVDDIALPPGTIRLRPKGGAGGHNGLEHINAVLGTNDYARIRIGIGSDFKRGSQRNFVLGKWNTEEKSFMRKRTDLVIEMIKAFATKGLELAMTEFNKAGKLPSADEGEKSPGKEFP
jgi:PTH1 family peptidyl-tRNA hydrolase